MSEPSIVRIEVNEGPAGATEVLSGLGVEAELYATDGLGGDPTTVALIALLGIETVRLIQAVVTEFIKRDRTVEIQLGKTRVRVSSLDDLEKVATLLNDGLTSKHRSDPEGD